MARPVEFDEQRVLINAMEQFWREGYEASSVQKLLDCTGINRGTLYNSFGDKDTFFKSCVDQYNKGVAVKMAASLKNPLFGSWEAIEAYLDETILNVAKKRRGMGCLLVNSLCESINYDREMRKVVRGSLAIVRKAILSRMKEASKNLQLKKGVSAEFATNVLINSIHGIRVNCRDGKTPKQQKEIIEFTVSSLKK